MPTDRSIIPEFASRRFSCHPPLSQARPEPGPREPPVLLDGDHRHTERLGDLGHGQPSEVPQGHDLALALVQLGQPVEGLVDRDDVEFLRFEVVQHQVERHPLAATATPVGGPPPGMVDEDLPHGPCSRREQEAPVRGLVEDRVPHHPDHSLVDHGGGWQGVIGTLPPHQARPRGATPYRPWR